VYVCNYSYYKTESLFSLHFQLVKTNIESHSVVINTKIFNSDEKLKLAPSSFLTECSKKRQGGIFPLDSNILTHSNQPIWNTRIPPTINKVVDTHHAKTVTQKKTIGTSYRGWNGK